MLLPSAVLTLLLFVCAFASAGLATAGTSVWCSGVERSLRTQGLSDSCSYLGQKSWTTPPEGFKVYRFLNIAIAGTWSQVLILGLQLAVIYSRMHVFFSEYYVTVEDELTSTEGSVTSRSTSVMSNIMFSFDSMMDGGTRNGRARRKTISGTGLPKIKEWESDEAFGLEDEVEGEVTWERKRSRRIGRAVSLDLSNNAIVDGNSSLVSQTSSYLPLIPPGDSESNLSYNNNFTNSGANVWNNLPEPPKQVQPPENTDNVDKEVTNADDTASQDSSASDLSTENKIRKHYPLERALAITDEAELDTICTNNGKETVLLHREPSPEPHSSDC